MIGWYNYTIGANDSCNNQNMSTAYTFNITDTTKPEITDIQAIPNPQTSGGPVNISITQNITGISYTSAKKYFSDSPSSTYKTMSNLFTMKNLRNQRLLALPSHNRDVISGIMKNKVEMFLRERV